MRYLQRHGGQAAGGTAPPPGGHVARFVVDGMEAQRRRSTSSWWLLAALLALNLLVFGVFLGPRTVGEQLRRQLCQRLQQHYPHLQVSIAAGRLTNDGTVILEGIELRSPAARWRQPSRPLLQVATLRILSDLQLDQLLDGSLPAKPRKIIAEGFEVDLWRGADGRWSTELLWPPLVMDQQCPRIEVRDGRVRLHRDDSLTTRPLEIDQIDATIDLPQRSIRSESATSSPRQAVAARFSIQASSNDAEQIRIDGDVSEGRLQLDGDAVGLRITPALIDRLPSEFASRLTDLREISLLADVDGTLTLRLPAAGFSLGGVRSPDPGLAAATEPAPWCTFHTDWLVHRGRFEHPRLPQALQRLEGKLALNSRGLHVDWLKAHLGESTVRLSDAFADWSGLQLSGRLQAAGLMVSQALASKLPQRAEQAWEQLRPSGAIDLDVTLQRRGDRWTCRGKTELLGVDTLFSDFPYPVTQVIGQIEFDQSRYWTSGLSARAGGQRLQVAFDQAWGDEAQPAWLSMTADGPVPIDSSLLAALTPRGQSESGLEAFVRSLAPSGGIHLVSAQFEQDASGQPHKKLDLRVSNGTLRYKAFPYSLYDIRGQILVRDDWVRLVGFQAGNSDNATIQCDGRFLNLPHDAPHPTDGRWQMVLRFEAQELPLDEALRAALDGQARQTWDSLSPSGVLDQAEITIHHADLWDEPRVGIVARQDPRPTIDNRTISLRAADIPYRIDLVQGSLDYDGDTIQLRSLDGRHDSTRIVADGRCRRTSSGRWRMDLDIHSGSRLHPDAELIGSLPGGTRGALQRLQLRGPLSARGTVGVLMPSPSEPAAQVDWDIVFQLEGNHIGDVGPVRDLRGEITMRGQYDDDAVAAQGELAIDSMHVHAQQITQIRGPFGIRDDILLLGETYLQAASFGELPELPEPARRRLEGRIFGGQATLSGRVGLSDGAFDVTTSLDQVDIATLLTDLGQGNNAVRGKAEGQLRLEGVVGAAHLLTGSGVANLSEANLYQLPLLISVFNSLRVKPSEAVAFTDAATRFSIYGESVTFNELRLWGDLIALDGKGTMNRSQEVDLTFHTRVSPHNVWSHLARPIGENRYSLWTLQVRGSLASPHIERRGIEAVGGTLERLIPRLNHDQPPAQRQSRLGQLRQFW